jgi:uncharacterized protein
MRLVLDRDPNILLVRSYDQFSVQVGTERLTHSCLITRTRLLREWHVPDLAALSEADLAAVLAFAPKIVLLGVVASSPLTPAPWRRRLNERGIALEALELGAACRTYNVLAQENRAVVLGVILDGAGSAPEEDTGRKD